MPQFIDVEDKIFGPLTFKQFIYLAGGAGMSVVIYVFLPLLIAIPLIIVIVILSLSLAFYKPNKRPFVEALESSIRYAFGSKLYIWKKEPKKISKKDADDQPEDVVVPRLSGSKLKELAWNLDVQDSLYEEYDDEN